MKERFEYIDIAKGVAILLVVMGHLIQFNLQGSCSNSVFNFIYGFHMPLFFFLSGYVASLSRKDIKRNTAANYLKKRFLSLVIPFLSWGCLGWIFGQNHTYLSFSHKMIDLILKPDKGLWFLITLFVIQVNFVIVSLLANRFQKPAIAEVIIIPIMLLAILEGAQLSGLPFYFSIAYNLSFFTGYFYMHIKGIVKDPHLFFFFIAFLFLSSRFEVGVTGSILSYFISVPASVLLLHIANYLATLKNNNYGLARLGRYSLEIYATHFYLVHIFNGKLDVSFVNPIVLFFILAIISFIICLITISISQVLTSIPFIGVFLYGKR